MAVMASDLLFWSFPKGISFQVGAFGCLDLNGMLQMPFYSNAPLLDPSKAKDNGEAPHWPLVIFSHGLGGGRTTYRFVKFLKQYKRELTPV